MGGLKSEEKKKKDILKRWEGTDRSGVGVHPREKGKVGLSNDTESHSSICLRVPVWGRKGSGKDVVKKRKREWEENPNQRGDATASEKSLRLVGCGKNVSYADFTKTKKR